MDQALASTIGALVDEAVTGETPAAPVAAHDRFETGDLLGEGGMGRVLHAEDRQFGRRVALKELPEDRATVSAHKRFLREALITGNLEHPGVPPVYERGVRDGRQFYAMRLVEGRTLAAVIDDARTTEERLSLVPAVVDLANTLGFAHAHGVIHRDVKPDNVVLGAHGETVLLDWGIARVGDDAVVSTGEDAPSEPLETSDGTVLGTPAYMSPEQASGAIDEMSPATDVFAIGAVLYHVLSGRPPYAEGSAMQVLAAAAAGDHPPIDRVAADAPAPLRAIVKRAMARIPTDRYRTADALAEELKRVTAQSLSRMSAGWGRAVATGLVVLAGLMLSALLAGLLASVNVEDLGHIFLLAIFFFVLGLSSSAMEYLTTGRYRLSNVSAALAGCTFAYAIAATSHGLNLVLTHPSVAAAPTGFEAVLLEGFREISGIMILGPAMAGLQLFAWAMVKRSVDAKS
jgi:hypothetical protein